MVGGRGALLGCAAGAWLAAVGVLAALAFGGTSCSPAFSVAAPGGDGGGAPPAADVGPPPDSASSDAAAPFCTPDASAAHTFCEDFSDPPFPGKFKASTDNGVVAPDTALLKSPPESAQAVTLGQDAGVATALLEHDFTVLQSLGAHFTLSDWVRFDSSSDCFPSSTEGVIIAAIAFPASANHYSIEILALPTLVEIVETTAPDGGAPVVVAHSVYVGALGLDQFYPWTVDLELGVAKTATVTVNGTPGAAQALTSVPAATVELVSPSLLLGASVTGPSKGCKVNVDDILFDIRATM
jgi:hypothetical protein